MCALSLPSEFTDEQVEPPFLDYCWEHTVLAILKEEEHPF
jgi:hypothetical protein